MPPNLRGGGGMVFCFVQNIYFFCRVNRDFFSPKFNIRLYDKNSESDYFFFSSTKIRIFFSATLGIRIFFLKKTMDNMKQPAAILVLLYWYTILVNLGPSNSDGSNTMDGSNLFESPTNFPYIFKLKKIFRSNTDTSNSRT